MNESNPPKRRGCFFYGCLSLVVLGLLLVAVGGIGFYVAKKTAARWINDYTDKAPTLVEQLEYSEVELNALNRRLDEFKKALDQGRASMELVLTADDLNALIGASRELRGKLFVRIDGDLATGDVSVPLRDMGPLKLNGRYLNGTATFKLALANSVLDVRVQDVQVRGKPLPSVLLNELRKENLAREFQRDPKTAADIAKFESIAVTNSRVILRNRGGPSP